MGSEGAVRAAQSPKEYPFAAKQLDELTTHDHNERKCLQWPHKLHGQNTMHGAMPDMDTHTHTLFSHNANVTAHVSYGVAAWTHVEQMLWRDPRASR